MVIKIWFKFMLNNKIKYKTSHTSYYFDRSQNNGKYNLH